MKYVYYRVFEFSRFRIIISWRSKNNFMGRFGGGWNWKLGIQLGSTTIIISLFVLDLILRKKNG